MVEIHLIFLSLILTISACNAGVVNDILDPDVDIIEDEMDSKTSADIIEYVLTEFGKQSKDLNKLANNIRVHLNENYKDGSWVAIIGSNIKMSLSLKHKKGRYVKFSFRNNIFSIMQTESSGSTKSQQEMIKSAASGTIRLSHGTEQFKENELEQMKHLIQESLHGTNFDSVVKTLENKLVKAHPDGRWSVMIGVKRDVAYDTNSSTKPVLRYALYEVDLLIIKITHFKC